ncbi:MAG: antitoxin MazE family protein [Polyangia bacterium]
MSKAAVARKNVQRYRDRMRESGLRLVQLWLPDTGARGFAQECRRQSLAAKRDVRSERDAMRWVESVRDTEGWSP